MSARHTGRRSGLYRRRPLAQIPHRAMNNEQHDSNLVSTIAQVAIEALKKTAADPEAAAAVRRIFAVNQPTPEPRPQGLMAKKQIAEALGVSSATVDRLTREGLPVAAFVGDCRRYELDACRAWLAGRGKKPTKAPKREPEVDVDDVVAAAGLVPRR